jgi:hypothetical protein
MGLPLLVSGPRIPPDARTTTTDHTWRINSVTGLVPSVLLSRFDVVSLRTRHCAKVSLARQRNLMSAERW